MLEDVVVIGYGSVKKSDATGSVTAIKPDDFNKGLRTTAQDALVGKVPGVNVVSSSGAPGGTVMASLGLITGVLGFDETGTALMLTIFALQDSFGTACNVTGDGALTLMLTGYAKKHHVEKQTISVDL